MKNIKRVIALFIVFAMSVIVLSSCENKKTQVVATYSGDKYVFENDADFADFYNLNRYFYAYETGETELESSDYNKLLSNAVKETIMVRIFEDELASRNYELDVEEILKEASNDVATFDSVYEGGFEKFCEDWGVSENVFVLYNKYEAMRDIAKGYINVKIDENEAIKYYNNNPEKYFKTPHYDISTIYLQVLDPSNKNEMSKAYNDAMLYIGLLNMGRSWESVRETALLKYNAADGRIFSEYLSMLNHVSMQRFLNALDKETALEIVENEFLAKNGMKFEEMFPGGFNAYVRENGIYAETKEYSNALEIYMKHASKVYDIEFEYAVKNFWEEGKTYSEPIYHAAYDSYVIVTFTRVEEENVTITFEEAKEDIVKILEEEAKEKEVENYISKRMNELKVRIHYR